MEHDLQESMLFGKEDELLRLSFANNFAKENYPKPFTKDCAWIGQLSPEQGESRPPSLSMKRSLAIACHWKDHVTPVTSSRPLLILLLAVVIRNFWRAFPVSGDANWQRLSSGCQSIDIPSRRETATSACFICSLKWKAYQIPDFAFPEEMHRLCYKTNG